MTLQNDENLEQTCVKYYFDNMLHLAMKNSEAPPKKPDGYLPLFGGWLKTFFLRVIARAKKRRCDSSLRCCYSLQKGLKQSWPALSTKRLIDGTLEQAALVQEPLGILDRKLEQTIINTATEVFGNKKTMGTKLMPSVAGSTQANREKHGALSLFPPLAIPCKYKEHDNMAFANLPSVTTDRENKFQAQLDKLEAEPSLFKLNNKFHIWRQNTFEKAVSSALKDYHTEYSFVDKSGEEHRVSEACKIKGVMLQEPSKLRGISVGNGYLYTALQPLQGQLLSAWKRCRYSTMENSDLTEMVQALHTGAEKLVWYSVDYKNATNLMRRAATHAALRGVEEHQLYALALASFDAGEMEFEVKVNGKVLLEKFSVLATGAQLMGHVLSFPLLCAINLAVYRLALDLYLSEEGLTVVQRRFRHKMVNFLWHRVLINGDDMLFKGPPDFLPYLRTAIATSGLKFSVGKNYCSPDIGMINSQLYVAKGPIVRRLGYLNQNLVSPAAEPKALPTEITADMNIMFKFCPESRFHLGRAMRKFEFHWRGRQAFTPNWFLPVHLGGYGLDIEYANDSFRITRSQASVAADFVMNEKRQLFRRLGLTAHNSMMKAPPNLTSDSTVVKSLPSDSLLPAGVEDTNRVCEIYAANEIRGDTSVEDWQQRYFAALQCSMGCLRKVDCEPEMDYKKTYYKHHRMKTSGFIRHWNKVVPVYGALPPCPSLQDLRLTEDASVHLAILREELVRRPVEPVVG
jgi:hypothetical protein